MLGFLGTLGHRALQQQEKNHCIFWTITTVTTKCGTSIKKSMYNLCVVCEHGLNGERERDPGYCLEPAVGV